RESGVGLECPGALDEELDRFVAQELLCRRLSSSAAGQRERRDREQMLSTHMQRFAAGHEQLEPGTTVQQLRRGGCRSGHLLEVVEDQQYTLISQPTSEFVEQRLIARVAQADRAYDRCEH